MPILDSGYEGTVPPNEGGHFKEDDNSNNLLKLHLYKVLYYADLSPDKMRQAIRKDVRAKLKAATSNGAGKGDAYSKFRRLVRDHIAEKSDIIQEVQNLPAGFQFISLYQDLGTSFMEWWESKKRPRNAPFQLLRNHKKLIYEIPSVNIVIKIEECLQIEDSVGSRRLVYMYLKKGVKLSKNRARLGLWCLNQVFSQSSLQDLRVLDVAKSKSWSIEDLTFLGSEKAEFDAMCANIAAVWQSETLDILRNRSKED